MKKIIALALAVLMLATALVSCNFGFGPGEETTPADTTAGNGGPNDPDATTDGDTTTADPNGDTTTAKPEDTKIPAAADDCNLPNISETSLSIINNSKTGFKIVYAAEMTSSAGAYSSGTNIYKNLAESLKKKIKSDFGVTIEIAADKDSRANPRYSEILVGPTDREESDMAMMFCNGAKGFVIKAINKKLVINAYTSDYTTEAMNYFITNFVEKQASSKTLTFASKDDYANSPTYGSSKSTIIGYSYKTYTIVVPAEAKYSHMRLARRIQSLIANRVGVIPMIVYDTDKSHNTDFEIRIGATSRTSQFNKNVDKLEYVIAVNGASLEINAGSILAFEYATSQIEKNFISDMNAADYNCGEITRKDVASTLDSKGNDSAADKKGELRLIVHNVWGWNEDTTMGIWGCAPIHYNSAQQRNLMMAELYIDMDADVIALQEYTDRLLRRADNYDISAILADAGYGQVYTAAGVSASATPIFYKKDKFTLLESNVIDLMKPYPGCGGDKYMTIAVLQNKEDGEIFGVISIHKDYRGGAEADANRLNMAKDAINQAKAIQSKYGNDVPVFVGGDFNCAPGSKPYDQYTSEGFVSAQKRAGETDTGRSHLGGPDWNAQKTIFFTDLSGSSMGSATESIDHIMVKGSSAGLARYDILTDIVSASISDHLPQVLDFNLN